MRDPKPKRNILYFLLISLEIDRKKDMLADQGSLNTYLTRKHYISKRFQLIKKMTMLALHINYNTMQKEVEHASGTLKNMF